MTKRLKEIKGIINLKNPPFQFKNKAIQLK